MWQLLFLPEAIKDLKQLDGSQQKLIKKALDKVITNPLPNTEGGYGKPLGNKNGNNLSNFLKVKLKGAGLRVVYQLIRTEKELLIIVIGARADNEVYDLAKQRINKTNLEKWIL